MYFLSEDDMSCLPDSHVQRVARHLRKLFHIMQLYLEAGTAVSVVQEVVGVRVQNGEEGASGQSVVRAEKAVVSREVERVERVAQTEVGEERNDVIRTAHLLLLEDAVNEDVVELRAEFGEEEGGGGEVVFEQTRRVVRGGRNVEQHRERVRVDKQVLRDVREVACEGGARVQRVTADRHGRHDDVIAQLGLRVDVRVEAAELDDAGAEVEDEEGEARQHDDDVGDATRER